MLEQYRVPVLGLFLLMGALTPAALRAQQNNPYATQLDQTTISGTVVSSSPQTIVVKTDNNQFILFVLDRYTTKPRSVPVGASVSVVSTPGDEGSRNASSVSVTAAPPASKGAGPGQTSTTASEPIPESVSRMERDFRRQARRFGMGVRTGIALDPELILVGVQARLGPFFTRDISFRPNVEFAFGEVTSVVALNFEGVYRLPLTPRTSRWSTYIGAGPGLTFIGENFDRKQGEGPDINFGDFNFNAALNIFTGIESRGGMFFEIKGSAYARPQVRLIVGYNF